MQVRLSQDMQLDLACIMKLDGNQLLEICQLTSTSTCTLRPKQNSLPVNALLLHMSQSYSSCEKKELLCSC